MNKFFTVFLLSSLIFCFSCVPSFARTNTVLTNIPIDYGINYKYDNPLPLGPAADDELPVAYPVIATGLLNNNGTISHPVYSSDPFRYRTVYSLSPFDNHQYAGKWYDNNYINLYEDPDFPGRYIGTGADVGNYVFVVYSKPEDVYEARNNQQLFVVLPQSQSFSYSPMTFIPYGSTGYLVLPVYFSIDSDVTGTSLSDITVVSNGGSASATFLNRQRSSSGSIVYYLFDISGFSNIGNLRFDFNFSKSHTGFVSLGYSWFESNFDFSPLVQGIVNQTSGIGQKLDEQTSSINSNIDENTRTITDNLNHRANELNSSLQNGNDETSTSVTGATDKLNQSQSDFDTMQSQIVDYQSLEDGFFNSYDDAMGGISSTVSGFSFSNILPAANFLSTEMTRYYNNLGDFKFFVVFPIIFGVSLIMIGGSIGKKF